MEKIRSIVMWVVVGGAVAVVAALAVGSRGRAGQEPAGSVYRFSDVREQTSEFHAYYREIELTPDQEAVMHEALTALEAPCCSDHTAYTCCCQCNMGKSWWGLAKHLIADRGLGADEVRTAVQEWFDFINPAGFSGNACYTGGCGRPFHRNGCGGMDEADVLF